MAIIRTSLVPIIFLIISVIKVHCHVDFSSPQSNLSNAIDNDTTIELTDTKNKALFDHLPAQSNFNFQDDKRNEEKSWESQLYAKLAGAHMLKLSILLPGFVTKFGPAYILNLTNHGLSSLIPGAFDELEGLKGLLLDNNNLGSLNASIFQGLPVLETLKIDMNNLSSLPNDVFLELINLKTITLNTNNFSSLPADLFVHNKKLKTVELTQNKVNLTDLPSKLFNSFVELENVILQSNGLQQLSEDLFWNSSKLKEIDLSGNYLKTLPKNLLRDARELRTLNLSSNHLTTLPYGFFVAANKLNQLDLSNNIIALKNWDFFFGLRSLRVLNMTRNDIEIVHPDAFISLPNLKIAKFAHNHLNLTTGLRNISERISPFQHCPLLEELDLSNNNISEMYKDWVMQHTLLCRLDLSYNKFSYLESQDLQFHSSRLYVDLSHNSIKNIDLKKLQDTPKNPNINRDVIVNLNYNPIECYCEVYSLVRYIISSDLNYVKLLTDNLTCSAPEDLRGTLLKDLSKTSPIEGAKISCSVENGRSAACASGGACDCHIYPGTSSLYLNCRARNLTEAPTWINNWGISNADVVLSDNHFREIPNLKNLAYESIGFISLYLRNNELNRIESIMSLLSKNVFHLDLSYNKITYIDLDVARQLAFEIGLSRFEVLQNPWPCNQQTLAFRDRVRYYYENWQMYDQWTLWDIMDFKCDINATMTQPNHLQPNSHFTYKNILAYTLALVLSILVFLFVAFFIIYRCKRKCAINIKKMKKENQEKSTI